MGEYFLQEGFARLWRGTNAGLALAVPTVSSSFYTTFFCFFGGGWVRDCIFRICCVYKTSDTFFLDIQVGIYLPCYDIFRNWFEELASQNVPTLTPYAPLVAGALARSLACATCYPIELARTRMQVILNLVFSFYSLICEVWTLQKFIGIMFFLICNY